MYNRYQLSFKFVKYYLTATNGKGHGVHSPFVFDFIKNVLNDKRQFYCFDEIEWRRLDLKKDNTLLEIDDFGAGSGNSKTRQRSVQSIASHALKPKKYGQLFFRMVGYFFNEDINSNTQIIELGTSLGITTAYLASANTHAHVITMEGAKNVAVVAQQNFKAWGLQNIEMVLGNFDETLPKILNNINKIDLAFIDGNHRKAPTLRYFEQLLPLCHQHSILIFDDIHWSQQMEAAWQTIKDHQSVTLTIDLFFIGLVFFRKDFKQKQNFVIRF